MEKKVIRLTEEDLKKVVKKSTESIIKENNIASTIGNEFISKNKCQLDEEINKIILEELGIADEVEKMTSVLYNNIYNTIRNSRKLYSDKYDINYKYIEVDNNFCRQKIALKVMVLLYNDERDFTSKKWIYNYFSKNNSLNNNVISITTYAISGTINKGILMSDIQHELEHLYTYIKSGKNFATENSYQNAAKDYRSNNPKQLIIAEIMYFCKPFEQDAFANGLYAQLKNEKPSNIDYFIHQSDMYKYVLSIRNSLTWLSNLQNDKELKEILIQYGISYPKLIKYANDGIKRAIWKIGRVITKYKKELFKEGVFFPLNGYNAFFLLNTLLD